VSLLRYHTRMLNPVETQRLRLLPNLPLNTMAVGSKSNLEWLHLWDKHDMYG